MSSQKIFGGPGSGKTTKLIKIIEDSSIPLDRVAYVTFATKALGEMKDRMIIKGATPTDLQYFRTLHSMNFNLLGIKKDQVVSDGDSKFKKFCEEKGFNIPEDKKEETLDLSFYNQMQADRNDLRPFNFIHPRFYNYSAAYMHFKKSYFTWLEENDYIDFIGMVEKGIEQAVIPPVELLCVDEWQDLTPLQIKQVTMWMRNIPKSYHAGDDDQSIHDWAGADPKAFLNLECDSEVVLNESFRLPSDILALSQHVITKNINRKEKEFFTNKGVGGIYYKSLRSTCDSLKNQPKNETCYFLIRNRYLFTELKSKLVEYGMPLAGMEKEKRAIRFMDDGPKKKYFTAEDILTITDGSIFPAKRYFVRGSKVKIEKLLKGGFPEKGFTLEQMGKFGMKGEFFEDLYVGNSSNLNIDSKDMIYINKLFKDYGYEFNTVKIMTIHESKGLEADTIVIVPYMASATFKGMNMSQDSIEAERRVWYTAITRPKKRLVCLSDNFNGNHHIWLVNAITYFSNKTK